MKHLPPTLRYDQRYLKIRLGTDGSGKEFDEFVREVNAAVKDFAGEKGLAEIAPWLIKRRFDSESQEAVVRINRDFEDTFRAALTLSDNQIITLKASGTLDSL